ncbi:MAG: GGDEF domain-containing protein [Pseudomonadota bacterium]
MTQAARTNRWDDLLFGTDRRIKVRTRMCLVASLVYYTWAGLSWFSIQHGLFINEQAGVLLIVLLCLHPLLTYPLVRSGWSMRLAEPGMILPQLILSFMVISFGYAINPDWRGAVLQLMCMTQMFGVLALTPAAIKISGLSAIASLLVMLLTCTLLGIPQFNPAQETQDILLACFIVGLLCWSTHTYAVIGVRVRAQRGEMADAVEKVNHIIMHDALTGLYNRRQMQDLLEREYARSQRTGNNYSIALIDLDHFKRVNDTYGHNVGDDVLVSFAKVAQRVLRETDVIARWGGEEFLVLMPDTAPALHAQVGLGRLRQALKEEMVSKTEPELRINFSAGVAVHVADETMDLALERADQALYRAKADGRDRHVLAAESTESTAHQEA